MLTLFNSMGLLDRLKQSIEDEKPTLLKRLEQDIVDNKSNK